MTAEMSIAESVDAIVTAHESVGEIFYGMLFSGYPDIRKHFDGVNMDEQAALVTMAFGVIEQYYTMPNEATRQYLRVLGSRHRRKEIPKSMYADWQQALLDTLKSFHKDNWNDHLAEQWKSAIENATRVMFEGYDRFERGQSAGVHSSKP